MRKQKITTKCRQLGEANEMPKKRPNAEMRKQKNDAKCRQLGELNEMPKKWKKKFFDHNFALWQPVKEVYTSIDRALKILSNGTKLMLQLSTSRTF